MSLYIPSLLAQRGTDENKQTFFFHSNSIFSLGIRAGTVLHLILNTMTSMSLNVGNFITLLHNPITHYGDNKF